MDPVVDPVVDRAGAAAAAGTVIVGTANDTLVLESVKVVFDNVRLRK